jgi:hypothetical protein
MNRKNLNAGGYAGRAWRILVSALQTSRAREARRFIRNNSHLVLESRIPAATRPNAWQRNTCATSISGQAYVARAPIF